MFTVLSLIVASVTNGAGVVLISCVGTTVGSEVGGGDMVGAMVYVVVRSGATVIETPVVSVTVGIMVVSVAAGVCSSVGCVGIFTTITVTLFTMVSCVGSGVGVTAVCGMVVWVVVGSTVVGTDITAVV